jgi:hypothetical protein
VFGLFHNDLFMPQEDSVISKFTKCVCFAVLAVPALAGITTTVTPLTISNVYASQTFGTVTVTADDVLGTVRFIVTPVAVPALYGNLSNFGIQRFAFNYSHSAISAAPSTWTMALPDKWTSNTSNPNVASFGNFTVLESGTGATRKNPLDFTIRLPQHAEATAANFTVANGAGYSFAAHIAGYATDPGSHWVGSRPPASPVPVPGAVALGGLGLSILGAARRRMLG